MADTQPRAESGRPKYRGKTARPNYEYWTCLYCAPNGGTPFFSKRLAPANPHERWTCPSCGVKSDELIKNPTQLEESQRAGLGPYKLRLAQGHYDVAAWFKGYTYQNREMPHVAPPGQFIQVPSILLDVYCIRDLSNLEFKLLCVLKRMTDTKSGWTPQISHGNLGLRCMTRGRAKAVERETISKALDNMSRVIIKRTGPDGKPQSLPLVVWSQTFPRRYKVNLP